MNTTESNLEHDVRAVAAPLKDGVADAVHALKDSRTGKAVEKKMKQVQNAVHDDLDDAETAVQHFVHAIRDRTESAGQTVSGLIQRHPYVAAGAAFSVGVLVAGALLNRHGRG